MINIPYIPTDLLPEPGKNDGLVSTLERLRDAALTLPVLPERPSVAPGMPMVIGIDGDKKELAVSLDGKTWGYIPIGE